MGLQTFLLPSALCINCIDIFIEFGTVFFLALYALNICTSFFFYPVFLEGALIPEYFPAPGASGC